MRTARKEPEMKKSRDSEEQIAFALKQAETPVVRRMAVSEQTF